MQLPIEAGAARETSLAVARRAVELGVTLIDTAHMYGGGADEELLAEALHPYPDGLLVTTKVGVARSGPSGEWRLDGRPVVLCDQVEQALRRLRVERLELLQLHRVDPRDIAGRPARRAAAPPGRRQDRQDRPVRGHRRRTPPSGGDRRPRERAEPLQPARPRARAGARGLRGGGIAFLPWRPVAWGESGTRAGVAAVAAEFEATPTQVALAWLLDHSPVILPTPGPLGSITWRRTSPRNDSS